MESTAIFSKDLLLEKRNKKYKKLLLCAYLKLYSPINGNIGIGINHLVKRFGYTPNYHKGKINSNIKHSIKNLKLHNDISICKWNDKNEEEDMEICEIESISGTEFIMIHIKSDSALFYPSGKYVILKESEFNKIVSSTTKLDKEDILNVFLNIKKYMSFRDDAKHFCFPSHRSLCSDCHITSTGLINGIIQHLESIGLIYVYNAGRYYDRNGTLKNTNNFYGLTSDDIIPEECNKMVKDYYSLQGVTINELL